MKHLNWLILIVLITLAVACRVNKPAAETKETGFGSNLMSLEKAVMANLLEFDYLAFKGQGRFDGFDMSQNITLSFRMKRHELVWVSVQAVLGVEVARALITKDSIFLIQNFPERDYQEYSLAHLSNMIGVTLSITQLQDFFLGNPILPYANAQIAQQGDSVVVEKKSGNFLLREYFANNNPKIARNRLSSLTETGSADIHYNQFQVVDTKQIPSKVNIFVDRSDFAAALQLNYSSISFEPITQFPFRKPGS